MFKFSLVIASVAGGWLLTSCGAQPTRTRAAAPVGRTVESMKPEVTPTIEAINLYQFVNYGAPALAFEVLHHDLDVAGDMRQTHVNFALNGKAGRWSVFFEKAPQRSVFYAYDAVGDIEVSSVHLKLSDGTLFDLDDLRGIKSNVAFPGPVPYAALPQYTPPK